MVFQWEETFAIKKYLVIFLLYSCLHGNPELSSHDCCWNKNATLHHSSADISAFQSNNVQQRLKTVSTRTRLAKWYPGFANNPELSSYDFCFNVEQKRNLTSQHCGHSTFQWNIVQQQLKADYRSFLQQRMFVSLEKCASQVLLVVIVIIIICSRWPKWYSGFHKYFI